MVYSMLGRKFIKWFATAVMVGLLLAVLFGVVGEWFIELARERGFYNAPGETLDGAVAMIADIVTSVWFVGPTSFLAGVLLVLWADTLRLVPRRPRVLTDAEALLAAAKAVAGLLEGRLRYARRVLDENKLSDLRKWREKINNQRVRLGPLLDKESNYLTVKQATALRECEVWFDDFNACVDDIAAGKGYKSNAHAAGLYRDRAAKCQAVLMQLIGTLSPEEGRAREREA